MSAVRLMLGTVGQVFFTIKNINCGLSVEVVDRFIEYFSESDSNNKIKHKHCIRLIQMHLIFRCLFIEYCKHLRNKSILVGILEQERENTSNFEVNVPICYVILNLFFKCKIFQITAKSTRHSGTFFCLLFTFNTLRKTFRSCLHFTIFNTILTGIW